jgi:hypothetical protein
MDCHDVDGPNRSLWCHGQWTYVGEHRVVRAALTLHRLSVDSADLETSNSHVRRRPRSFLATQSLSDSMWKTRAE